MKFLSLFVDDVSLYSRFSCYNRGEESKSQAREAEKAFCTVARSSFYVDAYD
jgi:hypothetical protein